MAQVLQFFPCKGARLQVRVELMLLQHFQMFSEVIPMVFNRRTADEDVIQVLPTQTCGRT